MPRYDDPAAVEHVARWLCAAHGISPDAPAVRGALPAVENRGYLIGPTVPAWQLFASDAASALRAVASLNEAEAVVAA